MRKGSATQRLLAQFRAAGYPTTLAELDAWYTAVPDDQNGTLRLLDAATALRTAKTTTLPVLGEKGPAFARGQAWTPEALRDTQAYFDANRESLALLESAFEHKRFRYPANLKQGVFTTFSYLAPVKNIAATLSLKAQFDAERGDGAAAARSICNIVRSARTLETEPVVISQLVQIAMETIGVRAAEQVLNRVALSEADFTILQQTFFEQRSVNQLERALVGEMCFGIDVFHWPLTKLADQGFAGIGPNFDAAPDAFKRVTTHALTYGYVGLGKKSADFEFFLRRMEELLAVARSEFPNRATLAKKIGARIAEAGNRGYLTRPIISTMILPGFSRFGEKDTLSKAWLRVTGVAMAVERFRLANGGQLPDTLAQLAPKFFPAVPEDPFDGQPLRYRKLDRGYVVYSVGADLNDDGGREFQPGKKERDQSDVTFLVERPWQPDR